MSAKHFLNDATQAVLSSLKSLTLTNPALLFDEKNKIIYRHPASVVSAKEKVSVICGGGSGHEPAFVGYVGQGLLSACVAGTIFASPGAEQVRICLADRLPDSKGILVVVMNYTGDVLNFGMGVEKTRAMGRKVEMIVVGDDVGVGREKGGKVGRRGIAGAALVVKACGALADMRVALEEIARIGTLVADSVVSVATSLSRTHVPGRPEEDAVEEAKRLPSGTAELGMGIHNEPGCERLETDLPGTVKRMLSQMLDQKDKDRAYVKFEESDKVVMLVNNFGGLSNLELGSITTEVWTQLRSDYGIEPTRIFSGVINGSLNGLGFGISILKLTDTALGPGKAMLDLIDYPTEAIGWSATIRPETWGKTFGPVESKERPWDEEAKPGNLKVDPSLYQKTLKAGLKSVIAAEADVTKFDTIVGDGDCGIGLKRGADAVLKMLERSKPTDDLLINVSRLIHVVEVTMDGTSGALYAIFLNMLAHNLRQQDNSTPTQISPQIWAKSLKLSLQALKKYTPAQPGDRTLIDALYPFAETLGKTGSTKQAAEAAKKGAESTRGMKASLGRTVYVGGEGWQGVPDPGAHGLSELLTGLANSL